MVVPRGLEPRTLRLLAVRSNQLSYETLDFLGVDLAWATTAKFPILLDCGQGSRGLAGLPLILRRPPRMGSCPKRC